MSDTHDNPTILLAIGRLEGKVDALLHSRDRHEAALASVDGRLQRLEGSKARLIGAYLALSVAASAITTGITLYISSKN